MKFIPILLALPLLAGCGVRVSTSNAYEILEGCITECVNTVWKEIGGGSGGGNSDGGHYIWDHRYSLSEQEMADRMSDFRELLLQKLEADGANIHGRGTEGNSEGLAAFDLSYSHADAEGMIWARWVSHGEGEHSVFIVWHGVKVD